MEIKLTVVATPVFGAVPGPPGPGKRFVFSDDLVLEGQQAPAGTHSGVVTTLRHVDANNQYLSAPGGAAELLQYEATFKLNAVTGLQAGEITVRGAFFIRPTGQPFEPAMFAITGGTGAYANARGQVTQAGALRTLMIVL
jgi:hypothetical protein